MDDQLRALERAARAAPDERAAGWALVRGLERAGDASAAWRETCRLARAGDDEAWEALEWSPRGASSSGDRVERRLPGRPELVSAGPGEVVLLSAEALFALDPATLETRWSSSVAREAVDPACAAGPFVVHAEGPGSSHTPGAIVVSERRTGAVVARRTLPLAGRERAPVAVVAVSVAGDRLVVLARAPGPDAVGWHHLVLALGDGLDLVHAIDLGDLVLPPLLSRDLLLLSRPPVAAGGAPGVRTVGSTLDGRERWHTADVLVDLDARGLLLASSSAPTGRRTLREVDHNGRERWRCDPAGATSHMGRDHVLMVEVPYGRGGETVIRVSMRDRRAGQPGWERAFMEPRGTRLVGAVGTDLAYVLLDRTLPEQSGGARAAARLEALDVRTGLTRWTAPVPLAGRPEWPLPLSLHALEDGLLVVEQSVGDGDTLLHRLGAP